MKNTYIIEQINSLLKKQIQGIESLQQTLDSENSCLVKRDFNAIQTINQRKIEQSALLEHLHHQQYQLLQDNGFQGTARGMNDFIRNQPSNIATRLRQEQNKFLILLDKCQRLNTINGNIITANKHSTETALAILRGQSESGNLTYSASGHSVPVSLSKPLFQA